MNAPDSTPDFPTIEDIARYCGDGTCQPHDGYDLKPPQCPRCGAVGFHRNSCKTLEDDS